MASNDTIKKTLTVTIGLSLVCSVLVSAAAVFLKPRQDENALLDVQQNILAISGLVEDPKALSREEVAAQFETVTPRLVDIQTGKFDTSGLDPVTYDQREAVKDPAMSMAVPGNKDIAQIRRQAKIAKIFEVQESGELKTLVLPVHGYGLWSTLYGYIALDADLSTVVGFGFYDHAETPGLGGEVDNPNWKGSWVGKQIFNSDGQLGITVLKGSVNPASPNAIHEIDGLSGATLTARGVDHLVKFWLGKDGFGPFLENLKRGEA